MNKLLLTVLNTLVKPLFGKGFVERYLPFLVTLYERTYYVMQPKGEKEVPIPLGMKLSVPYKDAHVGMYLITKGEFEPLSTKVFLDLLDSSSVVVDVGANFGYYTVLGAKKSSSGRVYSFEPGKSNFRVLKKNINLNGLHNVYAEEIALGNSNEEASFREDSIHSGRSEVDPKGKNKVQMKTLDSYADINGLDSVDFIKIDVEGYELEVLKGASNLIARSGNMHALLEFNIGSLRKMQMSKEDFFSALAIYGLLPTKLIHEQKGEVVDYSEEELDNILRRSTYINILFEKK